MIETNKPAKPLLLFFVILLLLVSLFAVPISAKFLLLHIPAIFKSKSVFFLISRLIFWSCLLIIFIYSRKIEKQKLILWEEKKYNFFIYVLSVIAIFMALFVGLFFISKTLLVLHYAKESAKFNEMLVMFRTNNLLIIFTCLTAGFVEELTFRGYLLPRMEIIFKSPVIAVFLSSILFGLLHFGYGTVFQIIAPFFIGLVFAYYYWEFRNIKVIIFCHVAWDLMAIYVKV